MANPTGVGRAPRTTPFPRLKAALQFRNDMREPSGAPSSPAGFGNACDSLCSQQLCKPIDVSRHNSSLPLSSFLGRFVHRLIQGKAEFQIVTINNKSNRSLHCFMPHALKKHSKFLGTYFEVFLAGITLNYHRFVKQQTATLGIIAPDARPLWKGGGSAEKNP